LVEIKSSITDIAMNCQEVSEFLMDFIDGTLPLRQRVIFKLHLLFCRDCRRYFDSYLATIKITRSLRPEPLPEVLAHVPPELARAILATCDSQRTETEDEDNRAV
jgi:predicted anti-sigma-YlaC factor YlaD